MKIYPKSLKETTPSIFDGTKIYMFFELCLTKSQF